MTTSDDTPSRLVVAAERLFADQGEEATSLRAITRAAMSNAAAVHYHFGGRDGLLRAVLDRHLGPLATRRRQLLEDLDDEQSGPASLTGVLAAALRPDLELLARLRKHRVEVARLVGRSLASHTDQDPFVRDCVPYVRAVLPDADPEELVRRLWLVRGTVALLFASSGEPGGTGPLGTNNVGAQLDRLVAFCAGGLAAPPATAAPPPSGDHSARRADRKSKKRR